MKLHLPKMLLGAVLGACVITPPALAEWDADAQTGGHIYLYDKDTDGTVWTAPTSLAEISKPQNATATDALTNFYMCNGRDGQATDRTAEKIVLGDGCSLTLDKNPWKASTGSGQSGWYTSLLIKDLEFGGGEGSGAFNILQAESNVTIQKVSGTLSSVNNKGTLTIGTDAGTTILGGTITNRGTLTINGELKINSFAGFDKIIVGSLTHSTHGYTQGKEAYVIVDGSISLGAGYAISESDETIEGAFSTESTANRLVFTASTAIETTDSIYRITSECTDIINYDGITGDSATATGFELASGTTLQLNSSLSAAVTEGITLTGNATIKLNGANVELNHTNSVTTQDNSKVAYDITNGTLNINFEGDTTNISRINIDGGKATLSNWSSNLGSSSSFVDIDLKNGGMLSFNAGGASKGKMYVNINVDGSGTLAGASYGNSCEIKGTVQGNGTLNLEAEYGTNVWTISGIIQDGTSGTLALLSKSDTQEQRVSLSGANTYSGGTTIEGGKIYTRNISALGTGKVTMNGGALILADDEYAGTGSSLTVSSMDYNSGKVDVGDKSFTVTGELVVKSDMEISGAGDTSIGTLDLTAGTTLTTTGSLTIGTLELDLTQYTDMNQTYNLVSTTGTDTTVTLTNAYTATVGNYTATVEGSGTDTLTLSFKNVLDTPLYTSVIGVAGYADGTLTLQVGEGLLTSEQMSVVIEDFATGVLDAIFELDGISANTMVGITLTDGTTSITATENGNVGFEGPLHIYYGEYVGGSWQYNVSYIPEPATATLSLLALMGLAARRRRK